MENNTLTATAPTTAVIITPEQLLKHWQGHRGLTRRIIEGFPEDKLFDFSIGGMRSFGVLAMEMIGMAVPSVHGFVTGEWLDNAALLGDKIDTKPTTKAGLLALWDAVTEAINDYWPRVTPDKFQQQIKAFNQYDGTVSSILLYVIDNEIHHRGQGYVYLRALGIEPAPFWDRP